MPLPPPPRFCLATEAETNHSSLFGNSCQAIFSLCFLYSSMFD